MEHCRRTCGWLAWALPGTHIDIANDYTRMRRLKDDLMSVAAQRAVQRLVVFFRSVTCFFTSRTLEKTSLRSSAQAIPCDGAPAARGKVFGCIRRAVGSAGEWIIVAYTPAI